MLVNELEYEHMIATGELADPLLCERVRERELQISRLQLEQAQDLAVLR